jgi:hypothetical protein
VRAAYRTELGPPEAIRLGDLPVPEIGPTDVLVEVDAVTVNPVDTLVRSGAYQTPTPFPFVVGRDLVGTVAAVGAGVAGFAAGDRVWCNSLGHGGRQGSFAEYAAVPAERLYHLPDGADPAAAVAWFHPAATAYLALYRHGRRARLLRSAARRAAARRRPGRRRPGGRHLRPPRPGHGAGAAGGARPHRGPGRPEPAASPPGRPLYLRGATITGFAISHAHVAELVEQATRGRVVLRVRDATPPVMR